MSLFLALECSTIEGSLVLAEENQKDLKCLYSKKWTHQARLLKQSHSDRLPLEIDQALSQTKKKMSDLDFLCVGSGPGRWTGVRTGLNVIRSLSFALQIPIYSINSLRICAEPFLLKSSPVFTSFNGFKNQVYFAEFHSLQDTEGALKLLNFPDWCEYMESKASELKGKNITCLSDLEDFYTLPEKIMTAFSFKKVYPHAQSLAQIVLRQKEKKQDWSSLKAFYLRSPLE